MVSGNRDKTRAARSKPPKVMASSSVDNNYPPSYFTHTKSFLRKIDEIYISRKNTRISSAAFERSVLPSTKTLEPYLSVNCDAIESSKDIVNYYKEKFDLKTTFTLKHTIKFINKAARKVRADALQYSSKTKCFLVDEKKIKGVYCYQHKPTRASSSHCGVFVHQAFDVLGEKEFCAYLTHGFKPVRHESQPTKRKR